MSENRDSLDYSGPNLEYKPTIGSAGPDSSAFNPSANDNHYSYQTMSDQLDKIKENCDLIDSICVQELEGFSLKIQNEKLLEAQKSIWPQSLPEVKEYVTYNQYKALEERTDRASKYIKDEYKKNIRGEEGSGAFDVRKLNKVISLEVDNIKGFLSAHTISDVNDSAQKRVAELLQDWSSSTLSHTGRLLSFFQERGKENTSKIPETEMASLTGQEGSNYQTLLKARINATNLELDRDMESFERHFLASSDVFYYKFLGPAINFNNNAASGLMMKVDSESVLGKEALKASDSIRVNMNTALTDLLHRNEIFRQKIQNIETLIGRRESLKQVFKQFSEKTGVTSDIYWSKLPDTKADNLLYKKLVEENNTNSTLNFFSSHNNLANREDPMAHPQYLLKSGDVITGDISVKSGVKIDGVDISHHTHSGKDGSQKISGESIMPGTIPIDAIKVDQDVSKPLNLKLLGYSDGGSIGDASFLAANIFWESHNEGQMYEIQITKRDGSSFGE